MLALAESRGFSVCAFDVPDGEIAVAVLAAAEAASAPVILGVHVAMDLERVMPGIEAAARRSAAPGAIWCHDVNSAEHAARAVNLGCNGISSSSDDATAVADGCGIAIAGPGGGAAMVRHQDTLSHVAAEHLHGAAGGTGYAELMRGVGDAVRGEAERCLESAASGGHAAAVLSECPAWSSVEHSIVYNLEADGHEASVAEALMRDGRDILAAIPGVREVVTGCAVTEDAPYRYCWIIRFAHAAVIESYRDHPDHVAFANTRFRPVAGGRISIDFKRIE